MDVFVVSKSNSNVDFPIIGYLVEYKSDSNVYRLSSHWMYFVEYKSDRNVDFPIIGCLVEYNRDSNVDVFDELKSDSNIDCPFIGCHCCMQK